MISLGDYKKHIKPFFLEEPFDFLIFRPIAYIIIKLTLFLPLNPNHFSFLALIISIWGGYMMSSGTPQGFLIGGLCIFSFTVLDCCDGMIARLKKNGSPYGQFIDMLVDLFASAAYYTGAYFGLAKNGLLGDYPSIIYLSGISIFAHTTIFSFYKKRFLFYQSGKPNGQKEEILFYQKEYETLRHKKGHFFDKFLVRSFLIFSSLQKTTKEEKAEFDSTHYLVKNVPNLVMWSTIAGSTHLAVFSLSLIVNKIEIYLYYSLVVTNIWMIIMFILQGRTNSQTKALA